MKRSCWWIIGLPLYLALPFPAMARKRKPWNDGLKIPGLGSRPETAPPAPLPGKIEPGPSTPGAPPSQWECLRCERIRDGLDPIVPDHTPRCPFRWTGRDPDPRG